jgi:hypothetical protein
VSRGCWSARGGNGFDTASTNDCVAGTDHWLPSSIEGRSVGGTLVSVREALETPSAVAWYETTDGGLATVDDLTAAPARFIATVRHA